MINPTNILVLLLLLQLKHFVCDFFYQPPYQYLNKGTYGHIGGIIHALQHAIPTFLILCLCHIAPAFALALALAEFILHYHIDWAKMNINKQMSWGPLNSEYFWKLLGFDQLLHQLTYVWLIWMTL